MLGPVQESGRALTQPFPVNDYRTARVAEVLDDFRTLQYYIAAAPVDPPNMDEYYTEGWAALRQCSLDGQRILNCAADITVPQAAGGPDEQAKADRKSTRLNSSHTVISYAVF